MISVTINYATLPFGLRRPRTTPHSSQYGLWKKTGDWATEGMGYNNIYWNFGEFLNDWSSGELTDELMRDLLDHPQDWGFCDYCSEGPRGDQDGFIRLKDWSNPDAHVRLNDDNDHKNHLEEIQQVPTPRKDYVISKNQMDVWWPFYHITGPKGIAEEYYTDLENQISGSVGKAVPGSRYESSDKYLPSSADDIFPWAYRMWWYFEPQCERDYKGYIRYKFDRDRFLEDVKKRMARANKLDPTKPLTPTIQQMAIIDSFSKFDSIIDIAKQELKTPALAKVTPLINYRVVRNPDETAQCIMPNCRSRTNRGNGYENICRHPLMIQ